MRPVRQSLFPSSTAMAQSMRRQIGKSPLPIAEDKRGLVWVGECVLACACRASHLLPIESVQQSLTVGVVDHST